MWFDDRLLKMPTTGFSLGCCGRSIFDHLIAFRAPMSISHLLRDNDREDYQDRSQDTAPHSVPSTLRFWRKTTRPGGDRPVLSPSSKAITAYSINWLSPKQFNDFWREFRKIYNFLRGA